MTRTRYILANREPTRSRRGEKREGIDAAVGYGHLLSELSESRSCLCSRAHCTERGEGRTKPLCRGAHERSSIILFFALSSGVDNHWRPFFFILGCDGSASSPPLRYHIPLTCTNRGLSPYFDQSTTLHTQLCSLAYQIYDLLVSVISPKRDRICSFVKSSLSTTPGNLLKVKSPPQNPISENHFSRTSNRSCVEQFAVPFHHPLSSSSFSSVSNRATGRLRSGRRVRRRCTRLGGGLS